jgi:hypothetical protein
LLAEVAKYFGGAYPIPELMKLRYKDIKFWYSIIERRTAEAHILNERTRNNKGPVSPITLRRMVDKMVEDWHKEIE